ncbi:MAG: ThiF family adenylyltransferase [Planctomycetes bacterium]|nr:ThiF family adenylyltransferase [Planctomycetota bacterium]
MNLNRLKSSLDIERTLNAKVGVIGAGGSMGLICDLARCGIQHFVLADPDMLESANLARQGHMAAHVGHFKVEAAAALVASINREAEVLGLPVDFTTLSEEAIDAHFGDCNLLLFCTDSFKAQAFGNQVALRLGIPAIWVGLYRGGRAGEVIFWHEDLRPCFRCICASRYGAHEQAQTQGIRLDPPSDGADIFTIHFLDSIVGMVSLGQLTRGADNRYGRLIEQLGDRNFLQVKIDPSWTLRDHDIVREQLGIAETCDAYFAWNTIVRRDPDGGEPPCPDCVKYRGRTPKTGIIPIPDGAIV